MAIVFVEIDLAKNVFAVHGVNDGVRPALVRSVVPRGKPRAQVVSPPRCTVGWRPAAGHTTGGPGGH